MLLVKKVAITTDASGDATYTLEKMHGYIEQVEISTGYDASYDFSLKAGSNNIWVETGLSGAQVKRPRVQCHDTDGAALTLDGTRKLVARYPLNNESLTIIVASGGNTKTATITIKTEAPDRKIGGGIA